MRAVGCGRGGARAWGGALRSPDPECALRPRAQCAGAVRLGRQQGIQRHSASLAGRALPAGWVDHRLPSRVRVHIRKTGDDRKFPYLPADEAVSIIYLTFQFLFPTLDKIHVAPADADDADDQWRTAMAVLARRHFNNNRNNPIAKTIQDLDDEKNRTMFSPAEFSQRVHFAIRLLFQLVCAAPSGCSCGNVGSIATAMNPGFLDNS